MLATVLPIHPILQLIWVCISPDVQVSELPFNTQINSNSCTLGPNKQAS